MSYPWVTTHTLPDKRGNRNVGKALYASWIHNKSKNYQKAIKDLTMNWKVNKDDILSDIVAPKGAEKIPGYSGFYALAGDVDEGIKQLDEVKTETYGYYLFENGKELVDITYTHGNANGGQSLDAFNTAHSETLKNAGDYTINFEIHR